MGPMFATLRRLFSDLAARDPATVFAEDDPRLAVAALMSHVVGADGEARPAERLRMLEELGRRYGLDEDVARDLAAAARDAELEAATVQRFTAGLQRTTTIEERREIVASLWKIACAEGGVREFEENVVWRIADLLGLEPHERTALRKTVEADCEAEALRAAEGTVDGVKERP
jgi:uncharacterized tellurite resistance protein B-like protein